MVDICSHDPGLQSTSVDDIEVLFNVHYRLGDMMRPEQAKTPVNRDFYSPRTGESLIELIVALCEG